MERFISPQDSFVVERAIYYLVSEYNKSGKNPKPVVLHSLRVGFHLLELNYEVDVIVTAVLHDLIEDSAVTIDDLEREFGSNVAQWVGAVSFRGDIKNTIDQYKEMFARTVVAGRVPVVVKAADLHVNSLYINLVSDIQKKGVFLEKIGYFLDITSSFRNEPALKLLEKRLGEERIRLKIAQKTKDHK